MRSHRLHAKQKDKIATEMYLKTIFQLTEKQQGDPRPIEIVHELKVSKASVSEMIRKLSEDGLVEHETYGRVRLTTKGKRQAKEVAEKYVVIAKFLKDVLKINPKQVHEEACNLEHGFSIESVRKLKQLIRS